MNGLSLTNTFFTSIFFILFTGMFNVAVHLMFFVEEESYDDFFSLIGFEMIGTSVIYVIPPLFMPCCTKNIQRCKKYMKFTLIWNCIGIVVTIIGSLIIIITSLVFGWDIFGGIFLGIFGTFTLLIRLLCTHLLINKPLKSQLSLVALEERDVPMSLYHPNVNKENQVVMTESYQHNTLQNNQNAEYSNPINSTNSSNTTNQLNQENYPKYEEDGEDNLVPI